MGPIIIPRVKQKTGHCGPASLEMIYAYFGAFISQDALALSAGIDFDDLVAGLTIVQLDKAVRELTPNFALLIRYDSTIDLISQLIFDLGLPVGVEWQGVFRDGDGEIFEEGHYSVVTHVDADAQVITLIDPDPRSALINGKLTFEQFEARWWDENSIPLTGEPGSKEQVYNRGLVFVLLPCYQAKAVIKLGLQPATLELMRTHRFEPQTQAAGCILSR